MKNIFLIIFVSCIAFSASIVNAQLFFMDNTNVGRPAPDFTFKNLSGDDVAFSQNRGEQRALIFFWATWCPYCRAEIVKLSEQKQALEKDGIKIFFVNIGEKQEVVSSFVDKNKVLFDVLIDPRSSSKDLYDIVGLPTLFFVNTDGVVTGAKHSFPENYKDILDKKFPN